MVRPAPQSTFTAHSPLPAPGPLQTPLPPHLPRIPNDPLQPPLHPLPQLHRAPPFQLDVRAGREQATRGTDVDGKSYRRTLEGELER